MPPTTNSPHLNPGAAGVRPFRPISASLDRYYIRRPRIYLISIIVAYLVAATFFALVTPAWQNPDEPAHYNNIAHIAGGDGLPMLRMGDYDPVYQGQLLESRFPPTMTVAPLRYESYQPPLYYLAAAPIFLVTNGSLLALRLFNVLLGAVALVLLYACLELVFPTKPLLSVGATAFAALLPMHVAMSAAVNNDGLAELLLVAALLILLKWMRARFYARGEGRGTTHRVVRAPGHLIVLGVLLGLGLETKIYAYVVLPLCAGVVLLVEWLQPRVHDEHQPPRSPSWSTFWRGVSATLWIVVPAVLIGLPLWIRNVLLYGAWDFLGLRWHDTVVAGQPTTAAWIARFGWLDYWERGLSFTFRSFWGVFGWLGVFMDGRIYTILLVFSGVLFCGLLWALVRFICGRPETDMDRFQFWVLGLFALMLLSVFASYVWYNAKFVQHQGRYFFWGLLPISALVALSWRELMQPLQGKVTGFLTAVLAVALALAAITIGAQDKLTILTTTLMAVLLVSQPFLLSGAIDAMIIGSPYRVQRWLGRPVLRPFLRGLRVLAWATPFLLLFTLCLAIPVWYIRPQLGR